MYYIDKLKDECYRHHILRLKFIHVQTEVASMAIQFMNAVVGVVLFLSTCIGLRNLLVSVD